MKIYIFAGIILFPFLVSAQEPPKKTSVKWISINGEYETEIIRRKQSRGEKFALEQTNSDRFLLIGGIRKETVTQLKQFVIAHPNFTEILVDSQGGDAASSIEIASIIQDRKLTLIVDGICFSACANFLFIAAEKKIVTEGSLVGIHEAKFGYFADGKLKEVTGNEIELEIAKVKNLELVIEYRLLQIREREFNKKFGIKNVFDEAFSAYISRRKKITRSEDIQSIPGTKSCPRILGWALSRAQLNALGVIGIEEFHFPYHDQKKPELEARMPLVRSGIYFGAEKDLATYCSGQPINWFEHQWNKLKKVF